MDKDTLNKQGESHKKAIAVSFCYVINFLQYHVCV